MGVGGREGEVCACMTVNLTAYQTCGLETRGMVNIPYIMLEHICNYELDLTNTILNWYHNATMFGAYFTFVNFATTIAHSYITTVYMEAHLCCDLWGQ